MAVGQNGIDFDKIYPIGSIYMSVNSTNPKDLFGGTWEQLKDRFLLGCGSKASGVMGGESYHQLTVDELPWHVHYYMASTDWASGDGSPQIDFPIWSWRFKAGSNPVQISSAATHLGISTKGAGSNVAHNNMPPYLTVYMWKRTA